VKMSPGNLLEIIPADLLDALVTLLVNEVAPCCQQPWCLYCLLTVHAVRFNIRNRQSGFEAELWQVHLFAGTQTPFNVL